MKKQPKENDLRIKYHPEVTKRQWWLERFYNDKWWLITDFVSKQGASTAKNQLLGREWKRNTQQGGMLVMILSEILTGFN